MSRLSYPVQSLSPAIRTVNFDFTTSTSGAILGTVRSTGAVLVKTASKVGRYSVQLGTANDRNNYARVVNMYCTIVGPSDVAMTAAGGVVAVLRNDLVTTVGTIDVQFVRPDTYVDAEVQNGARVLITLVLGGEGYK